MYNQTEKVNIRPKSYLPVFRVSQNDVGRTLTAHLVSDEGDISIPAGATVTMAGTKPSGLGYTVTGTVDGTDVSFETDAVMTDEPGRIVSEIRIVQDGTVIGTTNVVVMVEPDPHPDDTTDGQREPLVNELTAILEQITEQADRVEEYSGKVLDMTVTAHESETATVTKTEGEVVNLDFGLPRGPQGETGPQGPQGETGPQGPKGDPGEVTQAEFDKLLITDTASGEIASFPDGAAFPMRSLKVSLLPIQSGSGTPSPDNVRPISGWDEVETHKTGKNLWNPDTILAISSSYVTEEDGVYYLPRHFDNVTARAFSNTMGYTGQLTLSYEVKHSGGIGDATLFQIWYTDGTRTRPSDYTTSPADTWRRVVVVSDPSKTIDRITYGYYTANRESWVRNPQVELGSTATAYEPYDGQTITTTLPTTVYGGTVDVVNGTLTVDRVKETFDGSADESWAKYGTGTRFTVDVPDYTSPISSTIDDKLVANYLQTIAKSGQGVVTGVISGGDTGYHKIMVNIGIEDLADMRAYLAENPLEVVYPLATPTSYSLTPQEVQTLLGRNNVWSDGAVSVEYVADPKRYIQKMIGA